jgi:LuxR family transcriptional regulator, maltose regulon positive regulatory protein
MFAYCRSHYAAVLIWRGAWPEAEAELEAATGELAATFPAMAAEGIARLAELRRRQGRVDEAQALLDRLEDHPLRAMGSKLALLGRATLALERGDATTALDLAERYLRSVPAEDRVERVDGWELIARAQAALGNWDQATQAAVELEAIATAIATLALRAKASAVAGSLATAAGDLDAARRHFEDAVDRFEETGAPYEASLSRLELAGVLARSGRAATASAEAQAALDVLRRLGAANEIERASAFLSDLETHHSRREGQPRNRLTARELEVLRLVAQGLSDKEIGVTLGLSEHTAHRHVANILTKLDVPSRAAAVAHAAHHQLL